MDLPPQSKKRLAKYVLQRRDEFSSFAEMYRDFRTSCKLRGIKEVVVQETMRKWSQEKTNSLHTDSLDQIAAFRDESAEETEAWLLGIPYVPTGLNVDGEEVTAKSYQDRDTMISAVAQNAQPTELLRHATTLLDTLSGLLNSTGGGSVVEEKTYTLFPENRAAWKKLVRALRIDIARIGLDPTDPEDLGDYVTSAGLDLDLIRSILASEPTEVTKAELHDLNGVLSWSKEERIELFSDLIEGGITTEILQGID